MNEIRAILRAELLSTAAELRTLKRWLRTPPTDRPAPPPTRFALWPAKQRATLLCMLIAHSRGRAHLRAPDPTAPLAHRLDDQARLLRERLEAMDAMRYQTPLLDVTLRVLARVILTRLTRKLPASSQTQACVAPTEEHRA